MTPPASQHDLAHARGHGSASKLEHDDLGPNRQNKLLIIRARDETVWSQSSHIEPGCSPGTHRKMAAPSQTTAGLCDAQLMDHRIRYMRSEAVA